MVAIVTDISYYQNGNPPKPIDFTKMSENALAVMIRVGYGLKLDSQFVANFNAAEKENIFLGTYHYFLAGMNTIEQAKLHLRYAVQGRDEFPLAIDLEYSTNHDGTSNRPGPNYLQQVLDYLHCLEDAGHNPVIYSRYTHILYYLKRPPLGTRAYDLWAELANYRLWLAQYAKDPRITLVGPNVPHPWVSYWMFQCSADGNGMGPMYGVHSPSIDLNVMP